MVPVLPADLLQLRFHAIRCGRIVEEPERRIVIHLYRFGEQLALSEKKQAANRWVRKRLATS